MYNPSSPINLWTALGQEGREQGTTIKRMTQSLRREYNINWLELVKTEMVEDSPSSKP